VTDESSPLERPFSRRRLLQGGAALLASAGLAAYLPESVRNAMASPTTVPFNPANIKHIVLLMQENRSFDHYFGSLSGVRGFSDPNPQMLPTGRSVFYQPDSDNPDGYLLPFHLDATTTAAQAVPSLSHAWQIQHASLNNGLNNAWLRSHIAADTAKNGPYTMGYYEQADIPFQYALANAFTVCDNYFCSVLGPTHPNRYMWMTGTVDPTGAAGGPALDNNITTQGLYKWLTMAEILQNNGISWKCYQQLYTTNTAGTQPTTAATLSSALNNYGTNILTNMNQFQNAPQNVPFGLYQNAGYGSTLFGSPNGNGLGGKDTSITNPYTGAPFDLTTNFEEDCFNGTLPTVSWIFPPSALSEHPTFLPAAGAEFVASKLAALAANSDLWNSTVFILDYDENDGYFDHVTPPLPPAGTANEFVSLESPGGTPGGGLSVGAGFRVPCIIISPWTVGGYVCSDAFDHTSVLQFLEKKFGVLSPNISQFRRQTFGDLTSAFRFDQRAGNPPVLPDTSGQLAAATYETATFPLPAFPGAAQTFPVQEPGQRPRVG
jgi:phospholipase C